MEIKLNKWVSVSIIILMLFLYFAGLPLTALYEKTSKYIYTINYTLTDLFLGNLIVLISYLGNVIIGVWLFINSGAYKQEKWTWAFIGLVYGNIALLLFCIILILQNIKQVRDLKAPFTGILLLLIVTFFLGTFDKYLISNPLENSMGSSNYSLVWASEILLRNFLKLVWVFINIVFAVKMGIWTKKWKIGRRIVWVAATVIFGLFPVILFVELPMIPNESEASQIIS